MPVVHENDISGFIASGKFCNKYLIFGDDSYLKKYYTDAIIKKSYDGDPFFNLQVFSGDIDLQNVYDAVNQLPVMSDRKCVLVDDFNFSNCGKDTLDALCELLTADSDRCTVILRFDAISLDLKRGNKEKLLINAIEKAAGMAVELNHRTPERLLKMLCDGAKKRNCLLTDATAKYLIEVVGEDTYILKNELDKLCFFVRSGKIEKTDIDKVCIKTVEASVYDLMQKVFACDASGALKLLDELFYMHIEPMIILYTASSSYVDMYRVFTSKESAVSSNIVGKDFAYGNRQFLLSRAAGTLKKFDRKKLLLSFDALLNADKQIKSFSCDERTILEALIVKLIYIIAKGESVDKTESGGYR